MEDWDILSLFCASHPHLVSKASDRLSTIWGTVGLISAVTVLVLPVVYPKLFCVALSQLHEQLELPWDSLLQTDPFKAKVSCFLKKIDINSYFPKFTILTT